MSMETVSEKRERVYQRRFDHDLARVLHEDGMSYDAIAEQLGVSHNAVARVCDPRVRERMDAATRRWVHKNYRAPCLGGCGALVWQHPGRSGYCIQCLNLKNLEGRDDVGDGELRCLKCGEWKPDDAFPAAHGSRKSGPAARRRRGHDRWCRDCSTRARREHREKNPMMQRQVDLRSGIKRGKFIVQRWVVLEPVQGSTDRQYREIGRVEAAGGNHAIELTARNEGNYIAVQESRFQPLHAAPVTSIKVVKAE